VRGVAIPTLTSVSQTKFEIDVRGHLGAVHRSEEGVYMSNKNNTTRVRSLDYLAHIFMTKTALLRSPTQPPGSPSSPR
jgi:hypothetical protein